MNFHTAIQRAIREVRASRDPDGAEVQAALQLSVRAWQLCDQPGTIRIHWDLFGTSVHAAVEKLATASVPVVVQLDEDHLPDTDAVRRDAAALATAVADRLDLGAGDPAADADQRWSWSTAAARLRLAADDLVSWA